jgi:hypothetical protein
MVSRPQLTIALAILLTACPDFLLGQQPANSSSKSKTTPRTKMPSQTAADQSVYRNSQFAFSYKIPFGWVDRTQQMQEPENDSSKSKLLLAVFERPPEAVGDTVNSAVIIAAESAASYPGLKTAADYVGPLTELSTSKGFKAEGDPAEVSIGTTRLVRLDFTRELGKLTMHQSSLVLLRNKFVVSFTFLGSSTDEVDELIDKLSFNAAKSK